MVVVWKIDRNDVCVIYNYRKKNEFNFIALVNMFAKEESSLLFIFFVTLASDKLTTTINDHNIAALVLYDEIYRLK